MLIIMIDINPTVLIRYKIKNIMDAFLKHIYISMYKLGGKRCIAQEVQLGALWWPRRVAWTREETYVYIQLIHFVVQQTITQHCKAITLQ